MTSTLTVLIDLAVSGPRTGAPWLADLGEAADVVVAAERAGVTAVRLLDEVPGAATLDPTVLASYLATRTPTLGYLVDVPTTHHAPYNVARRVLALDRATAGRAGVAVRLGAGDEVSDAVQREPGATEPVERWREYVEILQRLWESFPAEALVGDQESSIFVRDELARPIAFAGRYYTVRGPLDGPSSVQGRPVQVVVDTDAIAPSSYAAVADVVVVERDRTPGTDAALRDALRAVGRERSDVVLVGRTSVDAAELADPAELAAELLAWSVADGLDGVDLVPISPHGSAAPVARALVATVVPLLHAGRGATLRAAAGLVPVASRLPV